MFLSCIRIFSALLFFPIAAMADDLPTELLVQGKPIDPLCFEQVMADEWLDITRCGNPDVVINKNEKSPGAYFDDMIGYSYALVGGSADEATTGMYSYYKFIGMWNGSPVVLSESGDGGSGRFNSLMVFERDKNKIRIVQGFGGGDRCNGSVVNPIINEGVLEYDQMATPFDFLALAEDNPNELEPYEDLESSATSCFGIAHYRDNVLTGLTLTANDEKDAADKEGWTEKFSKQACFNQLYRAYLTQGKKDLNLQQLKEFTGEFNRVCIEAK